MKKPVCALLFVFGFLFMQGQSIKKVPISNSGCSLYTYCGFNFETDYSEDSSLVYVGECVKDEISYGVICVKLIQPTDDLDKAEETMISYLDYLKTSLNIHKAAGYGRGHQLRNNENTRGVIDFWEDEEKNNWKIKAWTDGKFIGFMYAYGAKELPQPKVDLFLESFRFPGM